MQDLVAVSVKNLTYTYKVSSTSFSSNVLDNISFSVNKGDLLGVIGPNGAGKTTLFSCMLGLFKDYQGEVRIFGHDIRKNNNLILQSIGYIPQQKSIEQGFPATVQEIVSLGLIGKRNGSKEKVSSALEMVDLSGQNHRRIGELSGGQQQRLLIAKALVSEPKLLILDEPTTSVDVETQNKFYTLVKNLNLKNNLSIIWASHDLDAVNKIANKVMCLNRSMFFHGDTSEFFGSNELIRMYSESSMQLHMRSHSNQNKGLNSGYGPEDANSRHDEMKG
ncbi:MAG: zinc ABC transporter ATP-binding protein [Candidatus Nitrosopolaris wilkensis]|nr:MAG: zinc ABC transporter ATP-binding protein [Candidatus Nitrosopolaris wilkensis]